MPLGQNVRAALFCVQSRRLPPKSREAIDYHRRLPRNRIDIGFAQGMEH
jgi:hypothetical protein